MNNCEKLLRAFIEAQGYEIQEIKEPVLLSVVHNVPVFNIIDYKVTKQARIMQHPVEYSSFDGDLFSLGCQVANDDIKDRLKLLGFELDKSQMHDVMETIIFHIARNK